MSEFDPLDWTATIEVSANSFEALRDAVYTIGCRATVAKSFRELGELNGGHNDSGNRTWTFTVKAESPARARIAALRKEADELEAGLDGRE